MKQCKQQGGAVCLFDKQFKVKGKSLCFVTQKLRPKIAEAGRINFDGVPAYSATKGGLVWQARSWLSSEDGEATAKTIQAIPRVGRAEDIADAIAAVAGEDGRWIAAGLSSKASSTGRTGLRPSCEVLAACGL